MISFGSKIVALIQSLFDYAGSVSIQPCPVGMGMLNLIFCVERVPLSMYDKEPLQVLSEESVDSH